MLRARGDGDIVQDKTVGDVVALVLVTLSLEVGDGLAIVVGLPAASA